MIWLRLIISYEDVLRHGLWPSKTYKLQQVFVFELQQSANSNKNLVLLLKPERRREKCLTPQKKKILVTNMEQNREGRQPCNKCKLAPNPVICDEPTERSVVDLLHKSHDVRRRAGWPVAS